MPLKTEAALVQIARWLAAHDLRPAAEQVCVLRSLWRQRDLDPFFTNASSAGGGKKSGTTSSSHKGSFV